MMNGFRNSQVLEMRKYLETMLDYVKQACKMREGLVEYSSQTSKEMARDDSKDDPERYYNLRIFDKGVSIVKTNYLYDEKLNKWYRSAKDWKYSIRCYGWIPQAFRKDVKMFNTEARQYGRYDTLNEAILGFKMTCVELFKLLGYSFEDYLELFDNNYLN